LKSNPTCSCLKAEVAGTCEMFAPVYQMAHHFPEQYNVKTQRCRKFVVLKFVFIHSLQKVQHTKRCRQSTLWT